jgi:hypothetical protein
VLLRHHLGSAMAVTCLAWSASVEWIPDPEFSPVTSLQLGLQLDPVMSLQFGHVTSLQFSLGFGLLHHQPCDGGRATTCHFSAGGASSCADTCLAQTTARASELTAILKMT